MPATVAVLHHLREPFLGTVGAPLRAAGLSLDERDLRAGDALPDLDAVDGIVTLGGEQSVRDLAEYPYLVDEVALLREAVGRELPVFGVCLGGQLLAHALGAEVVKAPSRTVAWHELTPSAAAQGDPLFGALHPPVPALHWNEDVFSLPPGAVELFDRPGPGVEAFRAGTCAWGVQFHPDADAAGLDGWYAGFAPWLAEIGVEEDDARAADAHWLPAHHRTAEAILSGFARVVADRD